ncbi:hypothetical protein Tco_0502066 [Tanacetum coccineum]
MPVGGNMCWGWRKLLQVRSSIRQFCWYRLGDGKSASVWFDKWRPLSPLMSLFSVRDITRVGFHLSDTVADVMLNGSWNWPPNWLTRFPMLDTVTAPVLDPDKRDVLYWRDLNGLSQPFSVGVVWDSIRQRDIEIYESPPLTGGGMSAEKIEWRLQEGWPPESLTVLRGPHLKPWNDASDELVG